MKYRLLTVVDNTTIPITFANDEPVVLSVPNAMNFTKGDEFVVGSAVLQVVKRRFDVSNMGSADLFVNIVGTKLDVQNGLLGTQTKFK